MGKKNEKFADIAVAAEQSVAGVKDPELRRIAYQKILESLLDGQRDEGKPADRPASGRRRQPADDTHTKRRGPSAYIEELIDEGFFKKPKTIANVKAELENRGHHIPITSMSGPLQKLCQRKFLRRARAKGATNKQQYSYSNW